MTSSDWTSRLLVNLLVSLWSLLVQLPGKASCRGVFYGSLSSHTMTQDATNCVNLSAQGSLNLRGEESSEPSVARGNSSSTWNKKRDDTLLPKHPNCFTPPFLASKLMLHRGVGAAALPVKTVSAVGATRDLRWRGISLTASGCLSLLGPVVISEDRSW